MARCVWTFPSTGVFFTFDKRLRLVVRASTGLAGGLQ
jgi:hypothetical protein